MHRSECNAVNTVLFAQGNLAIAYQPACNYSFVKDLPSSTVLDPGLISIPCAITFPRDTKLNTLLTFIQEGRHFLNNAKQSLVFLYAANIQLTVLLLFSYIASQVQLFSGIQLIWVGWIIIPLLSSSLLLTPTEPHIMRLISAKNSSHVEDSLRITAYFIIRFVPTTIILLFIFFIIMTNATFTNSPLLTLFGSNPPLPSNTDLNYRTTLLLAQNLTLFCYVLFLCSSSLGFLHRTKSLKEIKPHKYLIFAIALSIILQAVFSALYIYIGVDIEYLNPVPWYLYLIVGVWIIIIIVIDEIVKRHDKKRYLRFQQRLRILFDTKLGRYSPK